MSSSNPVASNEEVTLVVASGSVLISSNLSQDANKAVASNSDMYLLIRFILFYLLKIQFYIKT